MSLPELIVDFCHETIIGHESAFYKVFAIKEKSPAILTSIQITGLIASATVTYLNNIYVSLITQNDPTTITEKFESMCKINNHSAICLLNIICTMITNLHLNFDREKLDTKTYDTYMMTVKKQLENTFASTIEILNKSISHQCGGIDIRTCDPTKLMFSIGH